MDGARTGAVLVCDLAVVCSYSKSQFTGKKINYDEKVDVYSFGIIMWELLTRAEPYSDLDSHVAVAVGVAFRGLRPPVAADCGHPEYVALMRRCWDKDPDVRPNFTEVVIELERIQSAGL